MRTSPSSRRAGIVALALACLVSAAALQAQQQQQNQGTLSKLAEQKRQTSDTSATPVVLTIEGGGSLGVHEAGMTWAFVEIFKHLREGGSPGNLPRLRLAAVSGASAGSINALLAATAWCDKRVGRPPEESMMWRAWVPTGVQQLLPRHTMEGFDRAAGLFSRVYFRDVLYPALEEEWRQMSWETPERCRIPVGATITRLVPERVVLGEGDSLVSAYNQRWASTFLVTTRDSAGHWVPVFLARPGDADSSMGTIAVPIAGQDDVIQHVRVFDIFAASSGYPLAFGPYTLTYRRHTSTGWHIESAQFSDGGVFDNGPLGLGIGLHYNGAFWPDQFAKDSAPPLIVYVNPDRRRAWPNGPAETQTEMQDDGRLIDPRSSGVAAVFSLIGGAIPSARQQELQQTVRILKQLTDKRSRGPDSLKKELMFASTRWHPIAGARLSGFGAFLGEPLREYDFYVGIYDAFATIADGLCARTGRRDARFECVRAQLGRFVKQPPIELGSVAPQVLGRLYAREFRTKGDGPLPTQAGQPRLNTRSDSATYVVLAVERAMGAFMQDTTAEGRKTARKLQKCSGDNGGPLVSVLCGSGLHAVLDTLKNDMLVHALLAQRHDAGGGSCSRKSPPAESWPCTADERFLELVDQPFLEMHRLMRSLLDRMIVTTPDSSAAGIVVRAAGAYYFSSDERYRRGIDGGQTSLPPRQERWQLLPSSLSAFVGISGTIVGWEARVNPWAHLGLAWPVRLGIGRFAPDERDAFDRRARIITGPVAELKIHKFGLSTIRWGYNAWLGRDSASSHSSLAGKTVSYGGVTLFGNKVRVSMSRPPNTLQRATNRRYLYEVGLSDLNGLLYWALQGERGGKQPFRSEPTDMNGCLPHEVRAPGKLGVGDFAIVSVVARVLDNKTGVMVDSGAMYRLSTAGRWKDGRVRPSTAAGFRSGEAPLRGAAIGFGKPFRRANAENANWFTLMGYIGTEESSFIIGEGNPSWTAPKSGELVTYANDVKAFYGNNRGCVTLIVERLQ